MSATRDNNFTEQQKRGLILVVKTLFKKYNYIYDWKMADDWRIWATTLYVDLYVDVKKLSEFFNLPIRPYYQNYYESGEKLESNVLFSPIFPEERDTSEYKTLFDLSYNTRQEITDHMIDLYKFLPEEYKIKWETDTSLHLCDIRINNFITSFRD